MKNKLQLLPGFILLLSLITFKGMFSSTVAARTITPLSTPTPEPSLNQMAVGKCKVENLDLNSAALATREGKQGLVMDARPFALNQTSGKLSFDGGAARVTILHMNPFIYKYTITVTQKEIVTTAVNDFIKLLFPTALNKATGFESGSVTFNLARAAPKSKLSLIEDRLSGFSCTPSIACDALNEINDIFNRLKKNDLKQERVVNLKLIEDTAKGDDSTSHVLAVYKKALAELRDADADAQTICERATALNVKLYESKLRNHAEYLKEAQKQLTAITILATELDSLVKAFNEDKDLTAIPPVRCKGYKCVDQFKAYAQAALEVLGDYQSELEGLSSGVEEMQQMYDFTEQMKEKEGLFARTFPINKKFEVSDATISLKRENLVKDAAGGEGKGTSGAQSGSVAANTSQTPPSPLLTGGLPGAGIAPAATSGNSLTARPSQNALPSGTATPTPTPTPTPRGSAQTNTNNLAPSGQNNEVVEIGRPRFTLSGGFVSSPLPRRTFLNVKGFARDAQGNPIGDGSDKVVGLGENSPRRLLPMALLNSRLLSYKPVSLFFSVGLTAKRDDNIDVEYLLGPSVSFLNDRVLFTVGAYGGKSQVLARDLTPGDKLPDSVGDAKLFQKKYIWKPGFALSFKLSRPATAGAQQNTSNGSSSSVSTNDLNNEIRLGSIRFNLAVGLAFSSLEDRTYGEIAGFARDRQGNLTNGRTITRTVERLTSSDYRITPLALLHSRLSSFGSHDIYLSTGVTGKKTDKDFDIEYLLGSSVNIYRRKVFLTFGMLAGKQQLLGGDLFEGAPLGSMQSVTVQNRYVWKPAISLSYDVSKIVPRTRN